MGGVALREGFVTLLLNATPVTLIVIAGTYVRGKDIWKGKLQAAGWAICVDELACKDIDRCATCSQWLPDWEVGGALQLQFYFPRRLPPWALPR